MSGIAVTSADASMQTITFFASASLAPMVDRRACVRAGRADWRVQTTLQVCGCGLGTVDLN